MIWIDSTMTLKKIEDWFGKFEYVNDTLFLDMEEYYFKYYSEDWLTLAKILSEHITDEPYQNNDEVEGVFTLTFQGEDGEEWSLAIGKGASIFLDKDGKPEFSRTGDMKHIKKLHQILLENYIDKLDSKISAAKKELILGLDKFYNENPKPRSAKKSKNRIIKP